MKKFPTLYGRGSGGAVLEWTVVVDGDTFYTIAGQKGGALVQSKPTHAEPKNIGKANETTAEQQAELEAQAKFDKKLKQNYFVNEADIDSGFLEPQLAKPCKDYIDDVDWSLGQIIDDKLNGFACIITAKGAFTRTNEEYYAIPHILKDLEPFFKENPDAYIQGELFNPLYVRTLNKIAELIAVTRKPKDITPELLAESERIVQFYWYDGYNFSNWGRNANQDTELGIRRAILDSCFRTFQFKYIKPVRWAVCFSFEEMKESADEYIAAGGEGKIIKNPKAPYQHKRTKDLLKWKKQEDAEFRIISIEEGKGNYKGCAKKVWVENPEGKRPQDKKFKVNIEGAQADTRKIFENRDSYVGKWITARFQERSEYGVPQIPYTDMVAREDVEGKGAVNQK